MGSDQVLVQFLFILAESEYEVEKPTCSTGQKRMGKLPTIKSGDGNVKGTRGGINRCGEVGHMTVRCRRQWCLWQKGPFS